MKLLLLFLSLLFCGSAFAQTNGTAWQAILSSTFLNINVYKAKANLPLKKAYVYNYHAPATDLRQFVLMPNDFPVVTIKTKTETSAIASNTSALKKQTTLTQSTIPSSAVIAQSDSPAIPNPIYVETNSITTYSIPNNLKSVNFLRYKVVAEDDNNIYVRILPGCYFAGLSPYDTIIKYSSNDTAYDKPQDYIFQVSKKDLTPNNYYLSSSALIGKTISIPVRLRKEYWNNKNTVVQGTFSIGYGFGWKYKIGNNPYHTHYFSTILYAAGISQQKYTAIVGKHISNNSDSLNASSDEFAITYMSFGIAYEYYKFSVGIFCGKDKMLGDKKNWVYQDKWWWGVGIGYDLFK